MIGQQNQKCFMLGVIHGDAAQAFGIGFLGPFAFQAHGLIGAQIPGLVHGSGRPERELHLALAAHHEKTARLVDPIQTHKIQITPVNDIKSSGLNRQPIQDFHIRKIRLGDRSPGGQITL